mgnify:CR=1 FL=1
MHQRKSKKFLIYFFLLILIGSINNIEINNFKFNQIKKIKITGLEEINKQLIIKQIQNLKFENIFLININEIKSIFETNALIENYKISKIYPSTLNIKIKKTEFLAQIRKNGKLYLIGSNGKISHNNSLNKNLPYVFGKPNINKFLELKKFIDQSKFSFDQMENLYFFPSKRWDLQLKNKILLKLPKDNVKNSLDNAFNLLKENKSEDIKILDMRIKNQIIIND